MAQTSIHLRPCKGSSEIHNKREKHLDYVRADLSPMNEWWSGVESLGALRSQISALVKEKTGRKMQAKAEPLREGVVVIQEDTTLEQLYELGSKFKERFGVTLVQIAIHRDEGHWVDSEGNGTGTSVSEPPRPGDIWKPNLHAHLVFDWYDHESGKSIKTSKLDAVEMQTICAEVLGMERGVSSDKRHLEAAQYKARKAMQEFDALKRKAEQEARQAEAEAKAKTAQANKEAGNKLLKGAGEVASSVGQGLAKLVGKGKLVEREKALEEREKKANAAIKKINQFVENELPRQIAEQKERLEAEYQAKGKRLEQGYAQRVEDAVSRRTASLEAETKRTEERVTRQLEERLPTILKEGGQWGLTYPQVIELAVHGHTQVESVRDPDTGNQYSIINFEGKYEPIKLRWNKRIEAKIALDWYAFKEFCRAAINHAWIAINVIHNRRGRGRGRRI